jgi:hypothetical protein
VLLAAAVAALVRANVDAASCGPPGRRASRSGSVTLRAQIDADVGPQVILVPPRRGDATMTARLFPVFGGSDNLHVIADPLESAPEGVRTVGVGELTVADGHVSDRAGSFRVALADLFWGPCGVR